jgi:hypothetical protein
MSKRPPGIVTRATRAKLRERYREIWGRDWPHDDAYLNELWLQVAEKSPKTERGNYSIPNTARYETALMVMRENHIFELPTDQVPQ